jgi:hypothetical protein
MLPQNEIRTKYEKKCCPVDCNVSFISVTNTLTSTKNNISIISQLINPSFIHTFQSSSLRLTHSRPLGFVASDRTHSHILGFVASDGTHSHILGFVASDGTYSHMLGSVAFDGIMIVNSF